MKPAQRSFSAVRRLPSALNRASATANSNVPARPLTTSFNDMASVRSGPFAMRTRGVLRTEALLRKLMVGFSVLVYRISRPATNLSMFKCSNIQTESTASLQWIHEGLRVVTPSTPEMPAKPINTRLRLATETAVHVRVRE